MESKVRKQRGFTQVELMITVAIVGILASVALSSYRDYSRRAAISEVVLASSTCKKAVSEGYLTLENEPDPGGWGCEQGAGSSKQYYVGKVQTSSNGVVRVAIANLDGLVNNRYVYIVPLRFDGVNPMVTPDDLGRGVGKWLCGSDWLPVRNALPTSCRADTTVYSTQTFQ